MLDPGSDRISSGWSRMFWSSAVIGDLSMRALIAIPVFNEEKYLREVLEQTLVYGVDVLAVDDGSTDSTPAVLREFSGVEVVRHEQNRGYGAALRTAFDFAIARGYDVVVTMDSDRQHLPGLIPAFLREIDGVDIVSGSRYLRDFDIDTAAPAGRQRINGLVTDELNAALHLDITDAFCGYKAYRTSALARLEVTEDGYGMPLEIWVEAACKRMKIKELAVPRVYVDLHRSFGAKLDDERARLAYYQEVIDRAYARARRRVGCGMHGRRNPRFQEVAPE
jgi:dolichol-phosphate mannosyltransferase